MRTATDLDSLKVHAGSDGVWYLENAGQPRSSRMSVEEFIDSDILRRAECVRLIGDHQNVELIVALFDRKARGHLESVQVGTPLLCHTRSEREDPISVLFGMRRFARAPSQGGFHEVVEADYLSYAMARQLKVDGTVTDQVRRLLQMHPAWKPLGFIPTINKDCCARLIALILDPRWYVDICNPNRAAKLNQFLGLNPRTQAAVTLQQPGPCRNRQRCELVLQCWKDMSVEAGARKMFDLTGPKVVEFTEAPGLRAGDFLWRLWGYLSGIGPRSRQPAKSPVTADLRASIRFIDYLRLNWLQQIYQGQNLPDHGLLFDPESFFKQDVVEVLAYDHYMADQR